MKEQNIVKLNIDSSKEYLHSKISVYKTEKFVKATKFILSLDNMLDMIANAVIKNVCESGCKYTNVKVEFESQDFTLFFACGRVVDSQDLTENDIVFYKFISKDRLDKTNDQSVKNYLLNHKSFSVTLSSIDSNVVSTDFKKLYILTSSDGVNFPLLNREQMGIVTIENKNVLVQGVAGSGKTNICIDKIVFSACREYVGRVLYTTYSRGLLYDTKFKVESFRDKLEKFVTKYNKGNIVFLDSDHKSAIEKKLGVFIDTDGDKKIIDKLGRIISFLKNNVDYMLIEDLYKKHIQDTVTVANEHYFINNYVKNIKNHQLSSKIDKVKHLSLEIVYKEIYGLIGGSYNESGKPMTLDEYKDARKNSFSREECDVIYSLSQDYMTHLSLVGYVDNNIMSRALLNKKIKRYSLSVVDEVQDFTEVNLRLLKEISLKVFAVGDAMQMINPTYFSFAYLKRLLYEKDVVDVIELKHNYRSTKAISNIVTRLNDINIKSFGTHSFVIDSMSVDDTVSTIAIYIKDRDFIDGFKKEKYEDITIIVPDKKEKDNLKKMLPMSEVLTVSEIKGLERDNIMLYNIVSANQDKWNAFTRKQISKKVADENSVYRYYYNLLYVGITRARQNVVVYEEDSVDLFNSFFKTQFELLDSKNAITKINTFVRKNGIDIDDYIERVNEFIRLEQYDNAYFAASKIDDGVLRQRCIDKIEIYRDYVYKGEHRLAGIKFWQKGLILEAKQEFVLSKDETLIDLIDASVTNDNKNLSLDILDYYLDIVDNATAKSMTLGLLAEEIDTLHKQNADIKAKFSAIRRKR